MRISRKRTIGAGLFIGAVVALVIGLFSAFGDGSSEAQASESNHQIVVVLRGTGIPVMPGVVPPIDGTGTTGALCFEVPMFDLATQREIGTATDCISDLAIIGTGGGMTVTATTTFDMPGGTLVSRGVTTLQPLLSTNSDKTHITGSIPGPNENSILSGTKRFANATGPVRLSGAVDLSAFDPFAGTGTASFDCVFVIDLN
jgi:hypothetical protein